MPTVRHHCERQTGALIRIHPREPAVPGDGIAIPLGAGEALARLAAMLGV